MTTKSQKYKDFFDALYELTQQGQDVTFQKDFAGQIKVVCGHRHCHAGVVGEDLTQHYIPQATRFLIKARSSFNNEPTP